jgi:hypothetical protein
MGTLHIECERNLTATVVFTVENHGQRFDESRESEKEDGALQELVRFGDLEKLG